MRVAGEVGGLQKASSVVLVTVKRDMGGYKTRKKKVDENEKTQVFQTPIMILVGFMIVFSRFVCFDVFDIVGLWARSLSTNLVAHVSTNSILVPHIFEIPLKDDPNLACTYSTDISSYYIFGQLKS